MNTIAGGMQVWLWVLSLIVGIAFPLVLQQVIEPFVYRRRVASYRADVAKLGRSPKRYLAAIATLDTMSRCKAMVEMGIDENGNDAPALKNKALRFAVGRTM
jgi:hypothetical protein